MKVEFTLQGILTTIHFYYDTADLRFPNFNCDELVGTHLFRVLFSYDEKETQNEKKQVSSYVKVFMFLKWTRV